MTIRIIIVCLIVLGCIAPFTVHPTQALTFSVYDLAEWSTLLPAEQTASPGLLLAFSLRLHVLLLTMTVLMLWPRGKWFARISLVLAVLMMALLQSPPLEFLKTSGDRNYQQQLLFSVLSVIALLWLPIRHHFNDYTNFIWGGIGIVGLLALLYGVVNSLRYEALYGLNSNPGLAVPCLVLAYGLCLITSWITQRKQGAEAPCFTNSIEIA